MMVYRNRGVNLLLNVENLSDAALEIWKEQIWKEHYMSRKALIGKIERVVFNDPATIVLWSDGTKTVVKCQDGDVYSKREGLAMCIAKKHFGNTGLYNDVFRKWVDE